MLEWRFVAQLVAATMFGVCLGPGVVWALCGSGTNDGQRLWAREDPIGYECDAIDSWPMRFIGNVATIAGDASAPERFVLDSYDDERPGQLVLELLP